MPQHSLKPGIALIHGLRKLGAALGYWVTPEFPVDTSESGPPPAVDVAWFSRSDDPFPLMIFEVESTSTNAMANNPLKVFAQPSTRFEKPLFFFHLIATGGQTSTRIDNLRNQYGSFNYRIYRLAAGEGQQLLQDVMSQHRRIRSTIDYERVWEVVSGPQWSELADPIALLNHAYNLNLSPAERLRCFLRLARKDSRFLAELPSILTSDAKKRWSDLSLLSGYVGAEWSVPIVCSLMMRLSIATDEAVRGEWDDALIEWQKGPHGMTMIGPHFGLSRDYDQFLVAIPGPLVGLCFAVTGPFGAYRAKLCAVLVEVLKEIPYCTAGKPLAAWVCHLAARNGFSPEFAAGQSYLNMAGGIPETSLLEPNSAFSPDETPDDEIVPPGLPVQCPGVEAFAQLAITRWRIADCNRTDLALAALVDEDFVYEWAGPILSALWADDSTQ